MALGEKSIGVYGYINAMTPGSKEKHLFYLELAKLLQAGFNIRRAAAVLMDMRLPAAQVALLQKVTHGLEAGQTITSAFSEDETTITEIERSIIRAGERSGKLGVAFQHLADYHAMLASARQAVIRGMIYPIVVLHMAIFLATVPMALLKGGKSIVQVLGGFGLALLATYVVVFFLILAVKAVMNATPDHAGIDRLVNRLPWIGKARTNMAMARFCKVYHSCLLAGISMDETNQLACAASRSGSIREAGAKVVAAAKAGEELGPRFMAEDAFPEAFARSYSTGEEAGTLDTDLARWAKWFQDEAESAVRQAATMVPKVLYFMILAFAAWKIVTFVLDYYSMLDQFTE